MNILSICSALNNSYFAIEYNNKVYSEIIKSDENYHSLYLISKIKNMCKKESINFNDIDLIAVNAGPGSFTGIRVAVSIAKIIAGQLNIAVVKLNTAQILLTAFNKKYLIMDARKDMYYLGTMNEIKLIKKDNLPDDIDKNLIICDKRTQELFKDALCFEDNDIDLGVVMIKLAKQQYKNSTNLEEFDYRNLKANYIQTPPVF